MRNVVLQTAHEMSCVAIPSSLQLIQGKMERRLAEAEARGETAAVLAAQAEQVQEQAHVAAVTAEAAVSACCSCLVIAELLCWGTAEAAAAAGAHWLSCCWRSNALCY